MNLLQSEPIDSADTFGIIQQVVINPKDRTFTVCVDMDEGYGPVIDTVDAWDYVGIFDGVSFADLLGQRVKVVLRPDRAQIVEMLKE